jgi:hypothetical protein
MLDAFREVVVDTEFTTIADERPEPVCLVLRHPHPSAACC